MRPTEFMCWFDDEPPTDAQCVLLVRDDPEQAAETLVESARCGPDWEELIDGDPVRVHVRHPRSGKVLVFDVQVSSSIDYSASEVDGADGGVA